MTPSVQGRARIIVATGGLVAGVLIAVLVYQYAGHHAGQLPSAKELQEPIAPGAEVRDRLMLTEEQFNAIHDGKAVRMNMPGGGQIVVGPSKDGPAATKPAPEH
jgi:hypothetical protein